MDKLLYPDYLGNDKTRYFLGTKGKNTLVLFGLNPSVATNDQSDRTISRIKKISAIHRYDSFLMLNLYPHRSPYPNDLPDSGNIKLHNLNKKIILKKISKNNYSDFLFCWGDNISLRPYLKDYLYDIWVSIKPFIKHSYCLGTLTLSGNPRHPGRLPYATKFKKFDLSSYF
ncbi:MAG: DUF1643 domain-containing protein [Ignavibacteriota bacterium]|nr:DUF1643 domain-containing protein [Ignavibacteriota bacterium]MCO6446065.1 DUF1643 domain-containing protein [Ignavibacterium album]MCZ2267957.1 DUF1643 domain-containing protein [Ignavibacteriales bacterium]QKK00180.1 MAG: DUF1643 domain-containing protein [Ignavibacteriota bacterium]HOJ06382.1 DUF1643 domain-containing protein [Ignavibacteriaceae bacterium]